MPAKRSGGNPSDPESLAAGSPRLTRRQLEILRHVARGQTNREIATELGISPLTVRNHLRTIQRRLGTADRTHAVVFAIGSGWIPIPIVPHAGEPSAAVPEPPQPDAEASP